MKNKMKNTIDKSFACLDCEELFETGIRRAFNEGYEEADAHNITDPVAKAILMGSVLIAQQNTMYLSAIIEAILDNPGLEEVSDILQGIKYELAEHNKRPIGRGK